MQTFQWAKRHSKCLPLLSKPTTITNYLHFHVKVIDRSGNFRNGSHTHTLASGSQGDRARKRKLKMVECMTKRERETHRQREIQTFNYNTKCASARALQWSRAYVHTFHTWNTLTRSRFSIETIRSGMIANVIVITLAHISHRYWWPMGDGEYLLVQQQHHHHKHEHQHQRQFPFLSQTKVKANNNAFGHDQ